MSSLNKVMLLGNLGRDPETRSTQDGTKIVHLNVATTEKWKGGERTEWHRVVIFNERLAEVAEKYLAKGRQVYLEGQLQTRKWTDQSGQERFTTEIVLQKYRGDLVLIGGGGDAPLSPLREAGRKLDAKQSGGRNTDTDLDEEIPFNAKAHVIDVGAPEAFV